MRVHVHSRAFRLLKQFFEVFQVVPADEDTRIVAHSDVHFRNLRIAVCARVGGIEHSHRRYAVPSRFQRQPDKFLHADVRACELHQRMLHESENLRRFVSQIAGVFGIGGHSLQSVVHQLLQRADVFVGGA